MVLEISEVVWYTINMFKQKPFLFSLLVLVVLISLHSVGSYFFWYWTYPWFDILVHTVSGLWAGSVMLWLASCLGQMDSLNRYKIKSFFIAVISAILIGILWELLEYFSQITSTSADNYGWHTAKDILSDTFGGILAHLYFVKRKKSADKASDVLHPFYNQTGIIKN